MDIPSHALLLEVEPGLARYLSAENREAASKITTPVKLVPRGAVDVHELLLASGCFTAILLPGGLLLQSIQVAGHTGLRLLGPGDFVTLTQIRSSVLVSEKTCEAILPTTLALLGRNFMLAVRQWPALVAGIQSRQAEQTDRLLTQTMICQLPRVEDRLRGILWLLAESWGQASASGTVLPLALSHSLLGGLIGARRPTVTLALHELTDSGLLLRQDRGWLLLGDPPTGIGRSQPFDSPRIIDSSGSWRVDEPKRVHQSVDHGAIADVVARLAAEHATRTQQVRERLARASTVRGRSSEIREQIASRRLSQRAPSS